MIAFTGSRSEVPIALNHALSQISKYDKVVVGCARGVDKEVREYIPWAKIFNKNNYGKGKGALARRSMAMCDHTYSEGGSLWAFPSRDCPSSVPVSKRAFNGSGSGTWATVAYALWLGMPVRLYYHKCPSQFERFLKPVSLGVFEYFPEGEQLSLF